jgi:hypothetical protein
VRHFLTSRGGARVSNSRRSRKRSNVFQTTYLPPDLPIPFPTIIVHARLPPGRSFSMPNMVDVVPFTRMHYPFLMSSAVGSLSLWLLSSLELVSTRIVGFRILRRHSSPTAVFYELVLRRMA